MIRNYVTRNESPEDDEHSKLLPSWPFRMLVWEEHSDGEYADEQGVEVTV